jgi:transposase
MPRPGLRLSEQYKEDLLVKYRSSQYHKDLDKCLRIQGLLLVSRSHWERDVTEIIRAGRRTLRGWIHRNCEKGIPGLAKGLFKGAKSKLTAEKMAELSSIIAAGSQEVGLHIGIWTTPIVIKLVKDLYGASYDPDHLGKMLHELRFSVQCPGIKLLKADEKA